MSKFESRGSHARGALQGVLSLALCLLGPGIAVAQGVERTLEPPSVLLPVAREEVGEDANRLRRPATEAERSGRELRYVLPIKYTRGTIYNPATGRQDMVELRSYGDSFVAPTIYMKPGQTVRMTLRNRLPAVDCPPGGDHNVPDPKCFNLTNLHTHGLWISPSGNSDNVLLTVSPGVDFQYEYNVPEDHPAGTFWYHPHRHGSTAVQVASGMAGALIIQGERLPTPTRSGDIDTLLKPFEPKAGGTPGHSEVLLFQQIPYACFNDRGEIQHDSKGRWTCEEGQVGKVEQFEPQFAVDTWGPSGRYTLLNGRVQPRLDLQAGRLYRFRLIHAGLRDSIKLRIAKVKLDFNWPTGLSAEQEQSFIEATCSGEGVDQWEFAADGLTRDRIVRKSVNELQPGYRSDVLVAFPSPNTHYCIFDDRTEASGSISARPENARLLAVARVKGGVPVRGDMRDFITRQLVAAADRLPANVRQTVKRDLMDGLKTTSFVPHHTITDEEVKGTTPESVVFDINLKEKRYMVNDRVYAPDRIDRTLLLGTAQEWLLSSKFSGHPYHIHVNPFQVVSIKEKGTGQEVDPEKDSRFAQYAHMKGVWRDTLFVQDNVEIRVRTRYQRYIGDFVLHCHILDHEDRGMMQNVRIALPDGKGEAMALGHQH